VPVRSSLNPIFGLIIVGCFFAGMMTLALNRLYWDEQFDQSPHRSQATVERKWITHGSKSGTFYHVRYHLIDELGRLCADEPVTSRATYDSARPGALVPVRYLDVDPMRSRIDTPEETAYHWRQDKVLFYMAGGIGVIWLLVWSSRKR
jgi:hypothetical protein